MLTSVSGKCIASIFRVKISQARNQCAAGDKAKFCLDICCMVVSCSLSFNPEDGGDVFIQNVDSHTEYMALYTG
jgi:hypothetical protein